MKPRKFFIGCSFCLLVGLLLMGTRWRQTAASAAPPPAQLRAPLGTAFTYQGQLILNGGPVNDSCDFQLSLWDAVSGGSQIGVTLARSGVPVTDGLFMLNDVDFGAVFDGNGRWLQIGVRCPAGGGTYSTLTPRQPLTAVPQSLFATNADAVDGLDSSDFLQTSGGTVTGDLGVGTSPQERLDVLGSMRLTGFAGQHSWRFGTYTSGGLNWLTIDDLDDTTGIPHRLMISQETGHIGTYGNVGIGTTDPTHRLTVLSSNDDDAVRLIGPDGTYGHGARLNFGDGNLVYLDEDIDDALTIYASSRTALMGGNVGVGTTSPSAPLHVSGVGRFDLGTGNIQVSTPGGWPGLIAYTQNGHRRELVFKNDRLEILTSPTSSPSATDNGIVIYENGTVQTKILSIVGGSDLAEPFEINGSPEPGMVVAIDPDNAGQLRLATEAYDFMVAGCVSGANGVQAGLLLQQEGTLADGSLPVALSGRVYCWADAGSGPIQPGDLLTTSDTPGHAMRAGDFNRAQGAILGKAMSSLEEGTGLVLVLVTLQ